MRTIAAALAVLVSVAFRLVAQPPPAEERIRLQPGQWLRVTTHSQGTRRFEGRLLVIRGEAIDVSSGDTDVLNTFALSDITRLELRVASRHRAWRGLAIGGLLGATAGGVAVIGDHSRSGKCRSTEPNSCGFFSGPEWDALAIGVFTGAGALAGAIIGKSMKINTWKDLPRPEPAVGALSLGWSASRATVGLRASFR